MFENPAIMQVPDVAEHFTWNSWHMSGVERKMIAEGSCFYIPLRYSEMPGYYHNMAEPIRAAMFQEAPMDKAGYFNCGPNASHLKTLCEQAEFAIVEVNENVPRRPGGGGGGSCGGSWGGWTKPFLPIWGGSISAGGFIAGVTGLW